MKKSIKQFQVDSLKLIANQEIKFIVSKETEDLKKQLK